MLKTLTRFSLLVCLLTFSSALTRADPIVITSGSLFVSGFPSVPVYGFSGTNFSVIGSGRDFGAVGPACLPCATGDAIRTGSNFAGTTLGQGTVTLNGTTFDNIFLQGELMFTGPDIVIPVTTSTSLTLTAPFFLSGFLTGCMNPLECHPIVFSTQVSGSGLATIQLHGFVDWQGRMLFDFRNVTYTFTDTTLPEPSSILFLTSGVVGLVIAKMKKRKKI